MRYQAAFLLLTATLAPAALDAQGPSDILAGIRNGGGWASIPIEGGRGHISTVRLPSAGLKLAGCVNVWGGHSGEWAIRARDNISQRVTDIRARPGVGVPFSQEFGMQAQVDFDFTWSEPRDTTLILWIGLDLGGQASGEACEPKYGG